MKKPLYEGDQFYRHNQWPSTDEEVDRFYGIIILMIIGVILLAVL